MTNYEFFTNREIFAETKNLEDLKTEIIEKYKTQTKQFIYQYFPEEKQSSINFALQLATLNNDQDKIQKIQACISWIKAVLAKHYDTISQIQNSQTNDEVLSMDLSFVEFETLVPQISLQDLLF